MRRSGPSAPWGLSLCIDVCSFYTVLKSLQDPIDTTTSHGRLTFNLFASLAEFERDVIRERTQAGLSAARARGRLGGRPPGITSQAESTAYAAEALYRAGKLSTQEIAEKLRIAKSTLYAYLRHRGVRSVRMGGPVIPVGSRRRAEGLGTCRRSPSRPRR